jgi:hypothetical protein
MLKCEIIFLIIIVLITTYSCSSHEKCDATLRDTTNISILQNDSAKEQAATLDEDTDFIARYICPNHCNGSGSVEFGSCTICGMELIENLDYQ